MKKITSIIIAAMVSFHLCAAFEFVNTKADWSGNVKEGSMFVLGSANGQDGRISASLKISKFNGQKLPYLGLIAVFHPLDEKISKNCPSITVTYKGRIIGAITSWKKRSAGSVDITRFYNAAIENEEAVMNFELSLAGAPENQTPIAVELIEFRGATEVAYELDKIMRPIWKPGMLTDETFFFISGVNGTPSRAKMLFTPQKILSAKRYCEDGKVEEYKLGKDFIVKDGEIEICEGSKIEVYPEEYMYTSDPQKAKELKMTMKFNPINGWGLFHEGQWFGSRDIRITYTHDGSNWNYEKFGTKFDKNLLPKTLKKLKAKKPLRICVYGDSIASGANSTANDFRNPFQPTWANLIGMALRDYYDYDEIDVINRSLGGSGSQWGLEHAADNAAPDKPDLVILAFGMNDPLNALERTTYIKKLMEKFRAENPDAEFIIVTQMMANEKWMDPQRHDAYIDSDKNLETQGIAVADVRSIHKYLLKTKGYTDMTGNNVNHPNDFLIRVYAQVIASKLMKLD